MGQDWRVVGNLFPKCRFSMVAGLAVGLALTLSTTGCIIAPMIQSWKEVGATKSHRMQLLSKTLDDFNKARYWESSSAAVRFAQEARVSDVQSSLGEAGKDQRLVDSKIRDINFSTDAFEADVEMERRVYRPSSLIVVTETEQQHWVFTLTEGWELFDLTPVPKESERGQS